eukprot:1840288-Pyramimonas_sp.AAC.1
MHTACRHATGRRCPLTIYGIYGGYDYDESHEAPGRNDALPLRFCELNTVSVETPRVFARLHTTLTADLPVIISLHARLAATSVNNDTISCYTMISNVLGVGPTWSFPAPLALLPVETADGNWDRCEPGSPIATRPAVKRCLPNRNILRVLSNHMIKDVP